MMLDILLSAFRAIRGSKLRSFLTMLGVIIGTFSIISLLGIGQGVKQDVTKQISDLGPNILFILPGKTDTEGGGFNPGASVGASTLTESDVLKLRDVSGVTRVSPIAVLAGLPMAGEKSSSTTMTLAVDPSYFEIVQSSPLVAGRTLTQADLDEKRRVVVLDSGPRRGLFLDLANEEVVGKEISFSGEAFTVVGLIETPVTSSLFGAGATDEMFIPYTTAKELNSNTQIFRMVVQADINAKASEVADSVRAALKANHKDVEDFTVFTQEDLLGVIENILSLLTAAIAGIGAISLVVGGIGIMNIMLVSVTERTKEIGLRKALGASNGTIRLQFLVEAVVLSLLGSLIGVLAAWLLSFPLHANVGLTLVINAYSLVLALGFSMAVGIIFGTAPAIRASRLNPIDALRYE